MNKMLLLVLDVVRRWLRICLILRSSILIAGKILALRLGLRRRSSWRHQIDVLLVFRDEIVIESDCDPLLRFSFERYSHQKTQNEDEKKIDGFLGYFEFRHIFQIILRIIGSSKV